ncbi:GyrI-like domain-containing protein [Faecalicatena sp. AGMB00832]|uniref:GyrI-like domain-containing protein n=1 Tax=Faecalicatena faecalis TaxID=2726362 RepID=A0ABS6D5H9_9FIRM|nr:MULTISPECIES: GyrI-like domain-containing protein [Faecalicatena]MBU3876810.1 GyrI-like domain-containing protein [Faecalicatena faecalis]MCI6467241.1 GyrI-like domain-containing protein [Faecalicatena sp.]MDY5620246.1 GyrI-like domain-containing protein [Lachnospiraceae bacterium]
MDLPFRIENKNSFRVVGHLLKTTNQKGEGRKAIPLHWSKIQEEHLKEPLLKLANPGLDGLWGINIYNTDPLDSRKFEYVIAVVSNLEVSDELSEYIVPAMTWAVFPCTRETIGKTEAQAITKWLPKSKYRPLNKGYITGRMKSGAPDMEYYGKDGQAEVWIAVKEKR